MDKREGQGRGTPGEMESDGISPVIGDIERTTAASHMGAGALEGTVLQVLQYPLARDDLVRAAAGQGAPGQLLDLLARLPNRVYRSAEDVAGEMQRTPAGGSPGPLR